MKIRLEIPKGGNGYPAGFIRVWVSDSNDPDGEGEWFRDLPFEVAMALPALIRDYAGAIREARVELLRYDLEFKQKRHQEQTAEIQRLQDELNNLR